MNKPNVSFVIPNWNGKPLLAKHLDAVIGAAHGAQITVVDDASTDGSVEFLTEHYPAIGIVQRDKRQGFASSVNAGMDRSTGDVVVLLNSDVEPERGFLEPLLARFSDPRVFAVGCMDRSHDKDAVHYRGRGIAGWNRGLYEHAKGNENGTDTAWVSGGSGAFRRDVWNLLGGMDTLYNPFYWEDIDLSYRARKAGYTVGFEPKSIVDHYHESGAIKSSFSADAIERIAARNQLLFVLKNLTDPQLLVQSAFRIPVHFLRNLIRGNRNIALGWLAALPLIPRVIRARSIAGKTAKLRDRDIVTGD